MSENSVVHAMQTERVIQGLYVLMIFAKKSRGMGLMIIFGALASWYKKILLMTPSTLVNQKKLSQMIHPISVQHRSMKQDLVLILLLL